MILLVQKIQVHHSVSWFLYQRIGDGIAWGSLLGDERGCQVLIEGEGFYHLPIPFIRVVDFVCVGWLVWNVEFGNRRMKFAFFVSIQYTSF